MKKIMRKWEWITEACLALGFEGAGEIAYEIDQIILQLYGDKHTDTWLQRFKSLPTPNKLREIRDAFFKYELPVTLDDADFAEFIKDIANDAWSCIACVESGDFKNCSKCLFAKINGKCKDDESLFSEFLERLREV